MVWCRREAEREDDKGGVRGDDDADEDTHLEPVLMGTTD